MHQINLSTHWGKLVGPYGKTCMVGLCKKIMKLMWLGRKMSLADRQKKRNWCELRRKESLHRECSGYSKKTRQYHCPTFLKLSHIFRANCNDLEMVPEIINMEANCNDLGKGSRPLVPTQDVRADCHILLGPGYSFWPFLHALLINNMSYERKFLPPNIWGWRSWRRVWSGEVFWRTCLHLEFYTWS